MKESLGMSERGAIQELPSRRILRTGGRGLGGAQLSVRSSYQ